MTMQLYALQRMLEDMYRVRLNYQVDDFVTTDRAFAERIDANVDSRSVKEKLLVLEDRGELNLSLFLDPEIVACLESNNPMENLDEENLQSFLLALEGVSHFLYLGWNACRDRSVTLLELELQAEVDKFISTLALMAKSQAGRVPANLRQLLFENCVFDDALQGAHLTRYRDANRYAGKYCWQLEDRYLKRQQITAMWQDLRQFYRLPQSQKLQRIDFS